MVNIYQPCQNASYAFSLAYALGLHGIKCKLGKAFGLWYVVSNG